MLKVDVLALRHFLSAATVVTSVFVTVAGHAWSQTPIHEYRLNGNGIDAAGNADGVVGSEVTFTSSSVPNGLGQAVVFGTPIPYTDNDVIEVDNALFTGFGTGDFSIEVWLRRTNTNGRGDIIDANGEGPNPAEGEGPGFQLQITTNDHIRLRIDDANGFIRPDSTGRINDTQWHQVVIVVDRDDSDGFAYYIDGVLDSRFDPRSISGNIDPHQDLRFGSLNYNGSFAGEIAHFQVFDVVLSANEVRTLYCSIGADCDGDGVADKCALDSDNDGRPDDCDPCVAGIGSGDTEADYDSDRDDYTHFAACLDTGDGSPSIGCDCFDFDADTDTDLRDVAAFAIQYQLFQGCVINGVAYQAGDVDQFPNDCRSCQPLVSRTSWTLRSSGDVCRSGSGDVCDPAEVCDGVSAQCPNDVVEAPGLRCRIGSGDSCDPDEFCTGEPQQACPTDSFESLGTVCRIGSGDICDPDETCPGVAGVPCPGDVVLPPTVTCRGANGSCDVAEQCTGQPRAPCPVDNVHNAGFQCRQAFDICDASEFCDGINKQCPTDRAESSSFVCRSANGTCDIEERCDGFSNSCPNDVLRIAGTECRAKNGDCDVREVCTGLSPSCPTDQVRGTNRVCQSNAGSCQADIKCDGVTKDCPNTVSNRGPGASCADARCPDDAICNSNGGCVCPGLDICRSAAGVCDRVEFFDDNGLCPQNLIWGSNIVCRREFDPFNLSNAECDPPEYCTGTGVNCPADIKASIGDACGSGDECAAPSVCHGKCSGTGPLGARCTSDNECPSGSVCEIPQVVSLTCETEGSAPANGTACDNDQGACLNGQCSSLIRDEGQVCDGSDRYFVGDPNGFHCDNQTSVDLICCTGGRVAKSGQSGRCRQCCGNNGEINGGCPQNNNNSIGCCGFECVDLETDLNNCGECGNDCQSQADASVCKSSPQCGGTSGSGVTTPAVCLFDTPCPGTGYCTDSCNPCQFLGTCGDDCVSQAICDFTGIDSNGNLCEPCSDSSDCTNGRSCWSGCGGDFSGLTFCLTPNYCADAPGDCNN